MKTVESLYKDIQLFLRIINQEHRFMDKKLVINNLLSARERTRSPYLIHFESKNGNIIRLRHLSSGEKNDFILFFAMIFKTDENSLLLMDEPEISTHITWQMMFSQEVAEICDQTGMQVLVATHSPNIVRGFEDNVIILGEVE